MNDKFLKEAIECEKQWKKSGLLDGVILNRPRSETAPLLESQRLINEMSPQERMENGKNASGRGKIGDILPNINPNFNTQE